MVRSLFKIHLVIPRSLPRAPGSLFHSAGPQPYCPVSVVTGNVNFVFSRCSIATEIELNQDSVNLSQISFELWDCIFPGKQEVGGGAAVIEEREREVKCFSIAGKGCLCMKKRFL